ncbi:S41 family peptidase [Urinicoccus massiliensis]|uniref:S41 family peptidase n=1 Tax=Urinicoccus massiliensis TaxID=1723382 RepID=UPI0009318E05|nr:S41 family peptidase [Urinicoccus massiliensis]
MKKRWVFMTLSLLLVTNLFTFYISNRGTVFSNSLTGQQAIKMEYLKEFIKKNYLRKVDESKFYEGQLKGIVASLGDPYSEYYSKEEMQELMDFTSASFYGVGIVLSPGEDNKITVVSAIKGSPADQAGLSAGDKIIKVNGKDFAGDQLTKAVKEIKGKENTKVQLQVLKAGSNKLEDYQLERKKISIDTVISKKLDQDMGYIGITQFSDHTAKEFNQHLNKLQRQGIKSLILDLRGNPGGYMDTATEIADSLLPQGTIVTAKNRDGKLVENVQSDPRAVNLPMVVIINKGSASASEILAGALKDHKKATLIGEGSYGKGVIQIVKKFPKGDGLKLTVAEYFTPNGVSIDKKGIQPDVKVKLPENVKGIGLDYLKTDSQLNKAREILKNKV